MLGVRSFSAVVGACVLTGVFGGCNPAEEPMPAPVKVNRPASPNVDRAKVLLAEGSWEQAKIAFEAGALQTPPEPGSHVGPIALPAARGDMDQALAALDKARRAGHDSDIRRAAPWLVAVLDGTTHGDDEKSPGDEQADLLKPTADVSDLDAALYRRFKAADYPGIVRDLANQKDRSLVATRLLADSYWNLGQWANAVPLYRLLLRSQPNDDAVTLQLADSLIRLKRFDEGILFFQILADSHPEKPGYWKMLGDAAREKGDRTLAVQAYTTAIERGHKDDTLPTLVKKLLRDTQTPESP